MSFSSRGDIGPENDGLILGVVVGILDTGIRVCGVADSGFWRLGLFHRTDSNPIRRRVNPICSRRARIRASGRTNRTGLQG